MLIKMTREQRNAEERCSHRTKAPAAMKMTGFGGAVEQLATCILFLITPREAEEKKQKTKNPTHT